MGDVMIGPGGVARVPRSESAEIDKALRCLDHDDVQGAIRILWRLREQVSRGYHRNPGFRIVGVIGDDVHSVAYRHSADGKFYKHDFERGSAHAVAVERNGKHDILITSMTGVPLWDEF